MKNNRPITSVTYSRYPMGINTIRFAISVVLVIISVFTGHAYNMRRTTNSDGLSNSAILSLNRDDNGYLWIGTCDGVNIADGISVSPFSEVFPGMSLSGNIIETIYNVGQGKNWVLTNYGLDLVDTRRCTVRTFPQFHGQELLCSNSKGNLFVLGEDSRLFLYDGSKDGEFEEIASLPHLFNDVKSISVRDDVLWLVTSDGVYTYTVIAPTGKNPGGLKSFKSYPGKRILFSKAQGNDIFIISDDGNLSEISLDGSVKTITNIAGALKNRGRISDLVRDHQNNFFISFSTDGAMWVGINTEGEFQAVDLGLHVGVFCLEQSSDQDVVWIGSDCQGIYTYWDDLYSVRSFDFNLFNRKITHPVRAVFVDDDKNLWVGTKGDGVLKVRNFNELYPKPGLNDSELYTSANSALRHNSVFAFGKSSRPILWIASEEGLNYYSYKDGNIKSISHTPELKFIHGVYEENDSVLWCVTLGKGVIKARITGSRENPELSDVRFYTTDDGNLSSNMFFAIATDGKGRKIFCNRGRGVFEIHDGKLMNIPFKRDFGIPNVNDVFDAIKEDDALWIGTGHGLIKSVGEREELFFGPEKGFANNTIHEMLRDADGEIWMSTNKGIVRFNPENDESETYGRNYGLTVTEFSDGAGFNTGSSIIFGGINGITIVSKHGTYVAPEPFYPPLNLYRLDIQGKGVPLVDYFSTSDGNNRLELASNQNHFAMKFASPDFINAHSYSYYYTINNNGWINNGPESTISFNEINHGKYNLKVKYVNRATGFESEPYSIEIIINAPWYLSAVAKIFYFLLFMAVIAGIIHLYLRRQKDKQKDEVARLEQQHREEVYEEKLKFFTNITHEFCTPLTLIYGPCERILTYPGSDDYIKKYVELIRSNTERLNTLIQELIDFRRMETGNKVLKIRRISISELCNDIMNSFSELAERNQIKFINDIAPDITWNSDFSCIRKILNNLISNAFKYTHPGGTIRISVKTEGERLVMSVYNTGNGIREEDKTKIFNRYSVLDNVEENAIKGISNRNGLGMAICHSMVDMLDGSITIESEVGKFAEFIVTLPQLAVPDESSEVDGGAVSLSSSVGSAEDVGLESEPESVAVSLATGNKVAKTILVIDDNHEILTLLSDAFSDYNVAAADSAEKGFEFIRHTPPDLIISDIMMPGTDGMEFAKQIKGNKHTMHIPLILLSAKNSNEEKVEGLESGADAYVGKPFSLSYLKAVVKRMIESRSHLKEYYNTSASAFEYSEGRLMHREEKEYLDSVAAYIDEHIDDSELSPEQLAIHLKTSVRNLYRKFKEISDVSPNDFIKNQRMAYAAKLLLTTSMTVQEIIYRSGFTNRSHFYKEFDKRYGMTPKDYRTANLRKDVSLGKTDE